MIGDPGQCAAHPKGCMCYDIDDEPTLAKHRFCPWEGGHMSADCHECAPTPRRCCEEPVWRGHPKGSMHDTESWCVNCGAWEGVPEW